MESRRYYACMVRLNGETFFVAWYSALPDGFLRDPGGRLVFADAAEDLGVQLEVGEPVMFDFDRFRRWCLAPNADMVDCRAFLDAWNFLDDLTGLHCGGDTPYTLLSRAAAGVYDKLFWGNNLPAVNWPGEQIVPSWSQEDLDSLRGVLESGLVVLAAELAGSPPTSQMPPPA